MLLTWSARRSRSKEPHRLRERGLARRKTRGTVAPNNSEDSCQLMAKHKVATPVNWQQGDDVIIVPAVSDDEARQKYPDGWKTPKALYSHRPAAAGLNALKTSKSWNHRGEGVSAPSPFSCLMRLGESIGAECLLWVNGGRTAPSSRSPATGGQADVNRESGRRPQRGPLSGVKRV